MPKANLLGHISLLREMSNTIKRGLNKLWTQNETNMFCLASISQYLKPHSHRLRDVQQLLSDSNSHFHALRGQCGTTHLSLATSGCQGITTGLFSECIIFLFQIHTQTWEWHRIIWSDWSDPQWSLNLNVFTITIAASWGQMWWARGRPDWKLTVLSVTWGATLMMIRYKINFAMCPETRNWARKVIMKVFTEVTDQRGRGCRLL